LAENPNMRVIEKPTEIDLIPVEELREAAPNFYSLVRVNPMKERKCLKCGTIFKSLGYHTCSECRYSNSHYGVRAVR
jgi:tRNA(Ile2) C34 agmatinyltransferase TiaS